MLPARRILLKVMKIPCDNAISQENMALLSLEE